MRSDARGERVAADANALPSLWHRPTRHMTTRIPAGSHHTQALERKADGLGASASDQLKKANEAAVATGGAALSVTIDTAGRPKA
jgi:hypothetical protein